jgi:SpoU rRNA methylase family enzyme
VTGPEGLLMIKAQIAAAIETIIRLQLDDCKRAIKHGTKTIALNELEDAIRQLKLLAKRLEA